MDGLKVMALSLIGCELFLHNAMAEVSAKMIENTISFWLSSSSCHYRHCAMHGTCYAVRAACGS
jgi:hypothetical protein